MNNTELFHNLINLAAVDGKFTDEEVQFLAQRANSWDIPDSEFEVALAGISEGELQVNIPDGHEDRVFLLKEMIRLMAVDGELAEMEKNLCAIAAGRMDLTPGQFGELLESVISEAG